MDFEGLGIPGVFLVLFERRVDDRGWFSRSFCVEEFDAHDLSFSVRQANVSWSRDRGTLRGLHLQAEPFAEQKLVRCTSGGVYDIVVDVRRGSPTFGRWVGVELRPDGPQILVPRGAAHGFVTLTDRSEVTYMVSAPYSPEAEHGFRFDDPAFAIDWPVRPTVVSERDLAHPPFTGAEEWLSSYEPS